MYANMLVSGNLDELPEPGPIAHSNSVQIDSLIRKAIKDSGGKISLEKFMEIALYEPELGYYVSVNRIFGEGGDFVTAPELSPVFSHCIARQIAQVFHLLPQEKNILEFGAGSGVLALECLRELERLDCLPDRYYIYDISPALRERQYIKLQASIPHLVDRVTWLEEFPQTFNGCIIANEVLDAMPVHRVKFRPDEQDQEVVIELKDDQFQWTAGELSPELKQQIKKIRETVPDIADGYESEINLRAQAWIKSLSEIMQSGLVIAIDYGYSRKEYFQPTRYEGTLMCHYQHLAHGNPLLYPGIQDITSHVDFTDIAETAYDAGFDILGYTSQAFFLAGCGLESMYNDLDADDMQKFLAITQPIKQLVMPNEMGELFKVIGLGKNIDEPLIGFSALNQLAHL